MTFDYKKELRIVCPEGHGEAQLVLYLEEDRSNRGVVEKVRIAGEDCSLNLQLLAKGKDCAWKCRRMPAYRRFVRDAIG